MATTSLFRAVNSVFASLVLIQSIVCGVLSLMAILCTYGLIEVDLDNPPAATYYFTIWLHLLYLSDEMPSDSGIARVFPNEYFIYVFWLFFLFSLFLALTSATHLVHLAQNVKRSKMNASATVLVILTFLSCVYDLTATIIFAMDYVEMRSAVDIIGPLVELEYLLTLPIFMATLAAKGYILWVFNFAMAVSISIMLNKKTPQENSLEPDEHVFSRSNSAYDAFGDAVLSNAMEQSRAARRPTQFHRRPTQVNPYAQTDDPDDGRSTTTSWAEMPRNAIYLEPVDSIAPPSAVSEFVPQSQWFGSTPNLNMVEPEPDYSPEPTRRFGMNHPTGAAVNNIYATR